MSRSRKGRETPWMIGRVVSQATREKIGMASRGHSVSEVTRKKLRKANSGPRPWRRGIKLSLEHRQKISRKGNKHYHWRGGIHRTKDGYIMIHSPTHPNAKPGHPYVFEHRLVIEKRLGRYLTSQEQVHHVNGISDDNRLANLKLCKNNAEHRHLHQGAMYRIKHRNLLSHNHLRDHV